MECWDLYANIPGFKEKIDDKTEFDCMILGKSGNKMHTIVFEVKCYSDLNFDELKRQQGHLIKLTDIYKRFDHFHHFGLISGANLKNAKDVFWKNDNELQVSIITWADISHYLKPPRFVQADFELCKHINSNGKQSGPRKLI
jgi:hypothetical protein